MPPLVWLNGAFMQPGEARIAAFDAGLQHGVGLFETMLAVGERVIDLARHVERLRESARALGLSEALRTGPLADAVRLCAKKASLDRARLRLTITGGDLNLLAATGRSPVDPTVLISAQPATDYPPDMFDRGVAATIADMRINPLDPFQSHKTLNYWPRLRALQSAASAGAGEALFLQVTNHLAGGAVSNLFLVKHGALLTPIARGEEDPGAIPSPVLPGITRRRVIEAADSLRLGCATTMLSVSDLLDADEVFLTNSSWGVLPVVKVEAEAIGDAVPGPVTRRLRERWVESVNAPEGSNGEE